MRSGRLALAGLAGGGMLTVAVLTVMHQQPGTPTEQILPMPVSTEDRAAALVRCRHVTAEDPTCAAAWEAERRRFFGTDDGRSARSDWQEHARHE
ncbi:putative entry exclusion protein TrbK-alt [Sphingobium sp. 3R8]|uniref:putative entry exclusion protein TrbK-alt n=1 Tax=Sphingobium sp. 3R8 TaxID=2874921 RepID=UPI001CCEAA8B|nr:putative entry exclusion protein TrbK-alt [Sphingobium sp. 3R8]